MGKQVLICAVIAAISFASSINVIGQTIRYAYDAAGNRTLRTIVLTSGRQSSVESGMQEEDVHEDMVGNTKVLIYPNPTSGEFQFQIQVDETSAQVMDSSTIISLYSLSGVLLKTASLNGRSGTLDLSGYSAGVYCLKIQSGDESSIWRIIKE